MTDVIFWPGWLGGIAVGIYGLVQLSLTGRPLGVSTAYGNVCGFASRLPIFHTGEYASLNNWRLWFIIGLPLGGLIAALTSPGYQFPTDAAGMFYMGEMYERVLPDALWGKGLVLMLGGLLIGYGARVAGGCTSGHSITGMAMLNPPSFVASVGFFAGGIIAVQALFRLLGAV